MTGRITPPCTHPAYELRRIRATMAGAWCPDCARWVTQETWHTAGPWIPRDVLALYELDYDSIPYHEDAALAPCAVCGTVTTCEEHHIAPVAVFGLELATRYGTMLLCREHHDAWHRHLTPGLCTTYDAAYHVQLITLTTPQSRLPELVTRLAEQLPEPRLRTHIDTLYRRLVRWMDEAA